MRPSLLLAGLALALALALAPALLGCEQSRPAASPSAPSDQPCACEAAPGVQHTPSGRTQIVR